MIFLFFWEGKGKNCMEFLDKNTIKIKKEDDTLGNILSSFLCKEKETEFCAYQRSHFLEDESFFILKLFTKKIEPKILIEEVIVKIEKEITEIEKCFE